MHIYKFIEYETMLRQRSYAARGLCNSHENLDDSHLGWELIVVPWLSKVPGAAFIDIVWD